MDLNNYYSEKLNHYIQKFHIFSQIDSNILKVIKGYIPFFQLSLQKDQLAEIFYIIINTRLVYGYNIDIYKINEKLLIVNYDLIFRIILQSSELDINSLYDFSKKFILENLEKNFNENYENVFKIKVIQKLVIFTHNRPKVLNKCLIKYINNIKKFEHKDIEIIISDDSDEIYSNENKKIVNQLRKIYNNISYLGIEEKINFLNKIKINTNDYSSIKSDLIYIFGDEKNSSYGRNRNFISFYLKDFNFITVDDDSFPKVLTYKKSDLKNYISQMINLNIFDFNKLENFIKNPDNLEKVLIDVDFINYFKISVFNDIEYVQYSGDNDLEYDLFLIKTLNISLNEFEEIIPKNIINEICDYKFIYSKPRSDREGIIGLGCFYPKGTFKFRFAFPENLRIEDLTIGLNYFLFTGKKPIETNFALFHNKEKIDFVLTVNKLFYETIGALVYSEYFKLVKPFFKSNKDIYTIINKLNEIIKDEIKISNNAFAVFNENKKDILITLENCLNIIGSDHSKYLEIKYLYNDLIKTFFPKNKELYELKINNLVNKYLNAYINSMKIWLILENIRFNKNND